MGVSRHARCSFRSSSPRQNSNRNSRFTGFRLSCGKQATKQFSNRNKNGFFGFSTTGFPAAFRSLPSYPFAQLREAFRSRLCTVLPLEIAPRRLG